MGLDALKNMAGKGGYLDTPEKIAPFATPWRDGEAGHSPLILFPKTTQEVCDILRHCQQERLAIIPQGGNTGLSAGTVPHGEILLNLTRMNRIRDIDSAGYTLTAEAGCILQQVQEAASAQHRLFPLSMASQGSCTIGGNLATNAGGLNVLKYGTARELCLGIEAVLPDGILYNGLKKLRKDTSGYDLKQLLIGSEGTLGVITAATFKLFPQPSQKITAWLALPSVQAAITLYGVLREYCADSITAYEYISQPALEMVVAHTGLRSPLLAPCPASLLVELSTSSATLPLRTLLEDALAQAMEQQILLDGAIAESLQHAQAFWQLRERISEAERHSGKGIHCDFSLPIAAIPDFLEAANPCVYQAGGIPVTFGHLGDGNLHYNILLPKGSTTQQLKDARTALMDKLYPLLMQMGGSISAEHGIGSLRKHDLQQVKQEAELALMRKLKSTLDPQHLLNPGKIF